MLVTELVLSGQVREKDLLFAPTKQFERSSAKLQEYILKLRQKHEDDVQSAAYELKDLLRGSIITDSPAQTKAVFATLTSMQHARVFEVKNGFRPKEGQTFNPED